MDKKEEKPLCYGTYVGEGDILCGNCNIKLKKECMKCTDKRNMIYS
jgi:hypothetical protein